MKIATTANQKDTRPWYREPWPWLLMAGPFIVIVAGIYTAWLAFSTSDGLVADDYYKRGLAAGETLARSKHAVELGLQASMRLAEDRIIVRLSAKNAEPDSLTQLHLTLSHPTRSGIDQFSLLKREGEVFIGGLNLPASGQWLLLLEDEKKTWRLLGSVMLPAAGEVKIGGEVATVHPRSGG